MTSTRGSTTRFPAAVGVLPWGEHYTTRGSVPVSGSATSTSHDDKVSVVLVVALSALLVGERPTWHLNLEAALAALGALLVSLPMSS